jgi:hypothetical protein
MDSPGESLTFGIEVAVFYLAGALASLADLLSGCWARRIRLETLSVQLGPMAGPSVPCVAPVS